MIKKVLKPTRGLHDGSSFREIIDIWREKGICEVEDIVEIKSTTPNETMWIEARPWINEIGDILLYDNPILDKIHGGLKWNLALFANQVMEGENCRSWTFWPNHPKTHEKVRTEGIPGYEERDKESCFIGSHTTAKRNNHDQWAKVTTSFWMGGPNNQRLMPQEKYLNFLKSHKFGLCLPGVGPKCLREMELIGFGTVPIFTPGVSTDYYNKLEKDKHFLYAETPVEMAQVIKDCTKEKWEYMSNECLTWFDNNASPEGVFKVTTQIIEDFKTKNNENTL